MYPRLAGNARDRRSGTRAAEPSLLAGLLHDERGNRLSPSHAVKNGTRYRYYVSQALLQHRDGDGRGCSSFPCPGGITRRISPEHSFSRAGTRRVNASPPDGVPAWDPGALAVSIDDASPTKACRSAVCRKSIRISRSLTARPRHRGPVHPADCLSCLLCKN